MALWLVALRDGDAAAAQRLWQGYYRRLVALARKKLAGRTRLVGDEEDVALSAIKSFCRGMEQGRYPQLVDENELWNLLLTITWHKAAHLVRDQSRAKRGGGLRRQTPSDESGAGILASIVSQEPTPEFAVQVFEEAENLLGQLPDPQLVELALLKMEGYTNDQIAAQWQKSPRTVERKLNLIRQLWAKNIRPAGQRPPPEIAAAKVALLVVTGPHQGQRCDLAQGATVLVGRGPAAQWRLPAADQALSRVHFQVEAALHGCRLTNLSTKNGTYVNGQQVTACDLHDGDVILAGETAIRVSIRPARGG